MQSSGFRLSTFTSDIFDASGRNIIKHLIEHGRIDNEHLNECLKTKTRHKINEIIIAVNGTLSVYQRNFLKMLVSHLDILNSHLKDVEKSIDAEIKQFSAQMAIASSIPCIGETAAASIIGEIGIDMSRFKTAEHICSWAGLSPGNNESAGKKKRTSVTKGNPYIKSMLCEVAWVIAGKRNTYLSTWYCRLKQNKGSKKAIIALARKLLVIIYTMLKSGTLYNEANFEQRRQNCEQKRVSRYAFELKKLGLTLRRQPNN